MSPCRSFIHERLRSLGTVQCAREKIVEPSCSHDNGPSTVQILARLNCRVKDHKKSLTLFACLCPTSALPTSNGDNDDSLNIYVSPCRSFIHERLRSLGTVQCVREKFVEPSCSHDNGPSELPPPALRMVCTFVTSQRCRLLALPKD